MLGSAHRLSPLLSNPRPSNPDESQMIRNPEPPIAPAEPVDHLSGQPSPLLESPKCARHPDPAWSGRGICFWLIVPITPRRAFLFPSTPTISGFHPPHHVPSPAILRARSPGVGLAQYRLTKAAASMVLPCARQILPGGEEMRDSSRELLRNKSRTLPSVSGNKGPRTKRRRQKEGVRIKGVRSQNKEPGKRDCRRPFAPPSPFLESPGSALNSDS